MEEENPVQDKFDEMKNSWRSLKVPQWLLIMDYVLCSKANPILKKKSPQRNEKLLKIMLFISTSFLTQENLFQEWLQAV